MSRNSYPDSLARTVSETNGGSVVLEASSLTRRVTGGRLASIWYVVLANASGYGGMVNLNVCPRSLERLWFY